MNQIKKVISILLFSIIIVFAFGYSIRIFSSVAEQKKHSRIYVHDTQTNVADTNHTTGDTAASTVTDNSADNSTPAKTSTTTTTQTKKDTKSSSSVYNSSNPDWTEIRYDWTSSKGTHNLYISIYLDRNAYNYYCNYSNRSTSPSQLNSFVNEAYNKQIVEQMIKCFRQIQSDCGYSDTDLAYEVIYFVQKCITYQKDIDGTGEREHFKFPIETLFSKRGDCEDVSILMSALLSELGYGTVFLTYPDHVMVGVKSNSLTGTYYEYKGVRYYALECTNVCEIGNAYDYANKSAKIY